LPSAGIGVEDMKQIRRSGVSLFVADEVLRLGRLKAIRRAPTHYDGFDRLQTPQPVCCNLED